MRRFRAFRLGVCLGICALQMCAVDPSRGEPASAPATQADPTGLWDRDDGLGGVRIAACGDALCGDVVWLKDTGGPAHIGERVLYDLRKTATDTWAGSALNPEDGGTYAGTLVLAGDHLTTRGCVFGGLICKSVALSRPRR